MANIADDPEWLQAGVVKNDPGMSGSTQNWQMAQERPGAFVFLIAGIAIMLALSVICIREVYRKKYKIVFCLRYIIGLPTTSDQIINDRIMAEELQRRLNQEEREAEKIAKQNERQAWYENYTKDYTVIVTAKDLFRAHETKRTTVHLKVCENSPQSLQSFEGGHSPPQLKFSASPTISDEESEEIDDTGMRLETAIICSPVTCDATEENAQLFLRLPVKDKDNSCRVVDAFCSICFCDYEEGDKVVWSGLQCRHAFHDTCIIPWLSNGKKRCPVCRRWFVPGARIEDQKKELEERRRMEADVAESSETSDETGDCHSLSDQDLQFEISNGEADEPSGSQETLSTASLGLDLESGGEQASDDSSDVGMEKTTTANEQLPRARVKGAEDLASDVWVQDVMETV